MSAPSLASSGHNYNYNLLLVMLVPNIYQSAHSPSSLARFIRPKHWILYIIRHAQSPTMLGRLLRKDRYAIQSL